MTRFSFASTWQGLDLHPHPLQRQLFHPTQVKHPPLESTDSTRADPRFHYRFRVRLPERRCARDTATSPCPRRLAASSTLENACLISAGGSVYLACFGFILLWKPDSVSTLSDSSRVCRNRTMGMFCLPCGATSMRSPMRSAWM